LLAVLATGVGIGKQIRIASRPRSVGPPTCNDTACDPISVRAGARFDAPVDRRQLSLA
jgi:hypothetical protein